MKKRGQAVSNPSYVATLISIIGAGIIVYILMLPPLDRAKILGQNESDIYGDAYKDNISILLTEEPGTLEYITNDKVDIDFPSFNLYTRTDAITIAPFDSIYLRRSLFNKEFVNVTFKVDELKFTDNIILSFFARKFDGRLTIKLNGNIIFNRELQTSSPNPLHIPKEMIKENTNILEFEVSGPGLAFWTSNEILLENIQVTADLTDVSGQENKQIFILTEKEKRMLELAELSLVPDCNQLEVAPLEIYMNKQLIFSSVPDCGVKMPIPQITTDKLLAGENYIRFRSDKGNYLIYGVKLTLDLEEPIYPTYYFKLEPNQYENANDGFADLNVTMRFSNNIDYKKGVIIINDDLIEIETKDSEYTRNIGSSVREGMNAIEIRPKADNLDLVEIEVLYAE